jgi:hypothetical protein
MTSPLDIEKKVRTIFNKPGAKAQPLAFCLQEPDDYCQELADKVIGPLLYRLRDSKATVQTLEKAFFMALLLKSPAIDLRAIAESLELPQDVLIGTLINYGFRVKGATKCSTKKILTKQL